MRLIDADKLIKQFDDDIKIASEFAKKSIKYDDYRDFDKSFAVLYMLKSYRAIVEDMKTAFDVEKVVEQLEEHVDEYEKMACECIDDEEEIVDILEFRAMGVRDAIEIVKAGGIDDNN